MLQRIRLRWFGHVQRKEDGDCVKKCVECPKRDGPNCKGRPKMTWSEVVNKDVKQLGMCKVNVLHRMRWKLLNCNGSAGGLLGSCLLEDECLVPAHQDISRKVP